MDSVRLVCIIIIITTAVVLSIISPTAGHSREHHHTATGDASNKFHDPSVVRDKEHVKEHLKGVAGEVDENEMSDEELEFHYFKMHDFDNNTKLDGLEMLAALSHMIDHDIEMDDKLSQEIETRIGYYTEIIDKVLEEDDFNNDGYLTYLEYVVARRRDDRAAKDAAAQKSSDL
ncbi:multiple coagulation factor deficiency protein 2 homolog isoform X1 [Glandiceps talaboti]